MHKIKKKKREEKKKKRKKGSTKPKFLPNRLSWPGRAQKKKKLKDKTSV
jgi:hypothetical protein